MNRIMFLAVALASLAGCSVPAGDEAAAENPNRFSLTCRETVRFPINMREQPPVTRVYRVDLNAGTVVLPWGDDEARQVATVTEQGDNLKFYTTVRGSDPPSTTTFEAYANRISGEIIFNMTNDAVPSAAYQSFGSCERGLYDPARQF